jgi:hypothetical protein
MPPLERLALPFACIALAACALAGSARAEGWTCSAGAGGSLGYQTSPTAYHPEFDPSWLVTADATRRLSERWAIHAASGDLHFSRAWPLISIPEVRTTGRQTVDFVPVGIGARFFPTARRNQAVQPWLEATPTLYVSRWRTHRTWEDRTGVPGTSGSNATTETRLLAGFAAGAGFQWRTSPHLRTELGVRYHFSASPGSIEAWDYAPRGLRQITVAAGLGWAP